MEYSLPTAGIYIVHCKLLRLHTNAGVYSLCFLNICRIGSILVCIWPRLLREQKSGPRDSKSTIFAKGSHQLFNLTKIGMTPIRGSCRCTYWIYSIYLWVQVWEALKWLLVSFEFVLIQICKFLGFKHRGMQFGTCDSDLEKFRSGCRCRLSRCWYKSLNF